MSSWRDQILKEFTPKVARLTLVADPDELLLEEGILEGIRERGFELIPFEDHVAFRYAYETRFRSRWDKGEQADRTRRVNGLLDNIASAIPKEDTRHDDWFHFAKTWAELMSLVLEPDLSASQAGVGLPESAHQRIQSLQTKIDDVFVTWLKKRYAGLFNLPPVPPVMLHHIPRFLARYIGNAKGNRVAFILVDGLSLDQWVIIRKALTKQHQRYRFRENALFAWIPTITSVSRQAAFAGKPPIYYPNSIHTTNKESALWTQFWADQGLTQHEVIYAKGLGDGSLNDVEELIINPRVRVAGLIINKVDKIMHGMELGAMGMHNQIRQWALQPFMTNLIDLLLDNGYRIYLTSDHGNVEAVGCGRPAEGLVADLRGERVRIYSDSILRGQIKDRFPDAIEWSPVGLPDNCLPLIAPGRSAFVRETERLVGHGGISLEEVVVPLVQIEEGGV